MHSTSNYLLTWIVYRKQNRLPSSDVLLSHKPSDPQELLFHLQIVCLMTLSNQLSQTQFCPASHTQTLLEDLRVKDLSMMLTPEYFESLFILSKQFFQGKQLKIERIAKAIMYIIAFLTQQKRYLEQLGDLTFLKLIGELCGVLGRSGRSEFLSFFKGWWSLRQWGGQYISESLLELILIWCQKGNQSSDSLLEMLDLFGRWFSNIKGLLSEATTIDYDVVSGLTTETKQLVKLCQLKGKKATKQLLSQLKQTLFIKTELEPEVFATLFSLLDTSATESELSLFNLQDLLKNEYFYQVIYYLQTMDTLKYFPCFHTFMKNNSVFGILRINTNLSTYMQKNNFSIEVDLNQMIIKKEMSIMKLFNFHPISLSIKILSYYQHLSGIIISEPKTAPKKRAITKNFKPSIPDPLQFMLIQRQFWEEQFGYEVLGLSLWIICEAYSKEIQFKSKDMPMKQVSEYIKKLKISLCIFLLGLKYPVKMLQFLPLEDDLAWDLSVVPITPGLLLDCGYFFKEFQREKLSFRERINFGIEGEVLSWASSLTAHKHIPFILHNHRGYQFFQTVLRVSSQANFKVYSEIILASLGSVLKKMGVSPESHQRKQALSQLPPETKTQIIGLLTIISSYGDKIGDNASGLISWLS